MFATIEIIIGKPFGLLHPTVKGIIELEKENEQDTKWNAQQVNIYFFIVI